MTEAVKGEIVPAGAKIGRPSSFSWGVANEILDRIAMGESLRRICMEDTMPDQVTVYRWLRTTQDEHHDWADEFRKQYAQAREYQADTFADEMNDIADDGSNDWMEQHDKDGNFIGFKVNGEHIQRSKLRIDTRKWQASKLKPKKYGEKIDVTSGGEPVSNDPVELAARAASLIATAKERKDKRGG